MLPDKLPVKGKLIAFRAAPDLVRSLTEIAAITNVPVSAAIRVALDHAVSVWRQSCPLVRLTDIKDGS